MKRMPTQQSGAALLSALLIMVFCATLAIFLLLSQRLLIHQSSLVMTSDRMTLALQEVQNWGLGVLQGNTDIRKIQAYHTVQNGMEVSGMIYALGGRFNINALQRPENISRFASVLQGAAPDLNRGKTIAIAYNLARWIMPSMHANKYYLSQRPPYRAANQPLVDLSELRLVSGITAEIYASLVLGPKAYVTALPTSDASINVNYASAPAFMSTGNINMTQAAALVACRDGSPSFLSVDDFIQRCAAGLPILANRLTVENAYYLVKGYAKQGDQQLSMQSLMVVNPVDNKQVAKILWQEYNSE